MAPGKREQVLSLMATHVDAQTGRQDRHGVPAGCRKTHCVHSVQTAFACLIDSVTSPVLHNFQADSSSCSPCLAFYGDCLKNERRAQCRRSNPHPPKPAIDLVQIQFRRIKPIAMPLQRVLVLRMGRIRQRLLFRMP